jgi:hypothetical protein
MRRRLTALAAALGMALISVSSVSADTYGPGLALDTGSETLCNGYLCATLRTEIRTYDEGSPGLCMSISYTNLELGGVEYMREMGCTGAVTYSISNSGFIQGFVIPHIDLDNTLDDSNRSTSVSASYAISPAITRTSQVVVSQDTPNPGCTTTYTEKARIAGISGTFNLGGTVFADAGTTRDVTGKSRVRC